MVPLKPRMVPGVELVRLDRHLADREVVALQFGAVDREGVAGDGTPAQPGVPQVTGEDGVDHAPAGGHTPMMIAMMTMVTNSWARFRTVSPLGRRSNASWVIMRAAVKPAHRMMPVSTAFQKKLPL